MNCVVSTNNQSTDDQIKALYARRQDAIISSIYELFLSVADPKQVYVLDIFNRLMLLLQSPCMFVLVKYDQEKKATDLHHEDCKIFNPHPLHQDNIRRAIRNIKDNDDFIEIFGSNTYRLLVLSSNQNNRESDKEIFKPVSKIDRGQIQFVLGTETYIERFGKEVLNSLRNIVDNCQGLTPQERISGYNEIFSGYEKFGLVSQQEDYNKWYKYFIEGLESKRTGYDLPDDGVIDKAYKKSRSSLAHRFGQKEPELANFLLFLRDYSRPDLKRSAGKYNFGLRILLCSKQEEDIRLFLVRLAGQKNLAPWYRGLITNKRNPYFGIGKNANEDFWGKLQAIRKNLSEKIDEKILEAYIQGNETYTPEELKELVVAVNESDELTALIKIIKKPLGDNTYSMAEPTFLSGIIHFRNPSVNAGLHRCIPRNEIEKGYDGLDHDEILRVVIVHYLLLGMAKSFNDLSENDKSNKTFFSVMLAPISVGGRVLGVLSYVTEKDKYKEITKEEKYKSSIATLSRSWRNNFHTYMATHKRIKRHLRTYFWEFYVALVFRMYYDSVSKVKEYRKTHSDEDEKKLYEHVKNIFNIRLSYIDRFFSYNSISCELKADNVAKLYPNRNAQGESQIGKNTWMIISVEDEARYFSVYQGIDQKKLGRFVDRDEIAIKISNVYYGIDTVMKRHKDI